MCKHKKLMQSYRLKSTHSLTINFQIVYLLSKINQIKNNIINLVTNLKKKITVNDFFFIIIYVR